MSDALKYIEPVERNQTLGKRVRDELRAAIMAGRFEPGEKLTIRAVASALGVSLTPAREALYNLAAEGALELAGNGSVYVPTLTIDRIAELTKIRVALEGLAAREAAEQISAGEIDQARDIHHRLLEANGNKDFRSVITLNWEFHFLIYAAAGLPHLIKMIESCWLQAGSYLNVIYPDFARTDDGIDNHSEILAGLETRDPQRLREAICRDIEFSAASLRAMVTARARA